MEKTIIAFIWIVGALCLFIIAFLTYDLIVRAQDRKAEKKAQAASKEGASPANSTAKEPSGTGRADNAKKPKK